ncbi:MAG: hypothetical protein Q9M46_04065 [Ghiorsea sp.]|nr:hypothetical protein [Ghiorsea sp.]
MRYFSLVLIFLLSSCVSTKKPEVPATWAKPVSPPQQGCINLSGTYHNAGESSETHKYYLSQLFEYSIASSAFLKHSWISSVTLFYIHEGKLSITFNSKGKAAYQITWLQGKDFTCQAQYIQKEFSYMPSNPLAIAKHTSITAFTKAEDGALLVNDFDKETGIAFVVIPYQEKHYKYYRYPAVTHSP